ncbi:MAG: NAD(+)/NADH kinase [Alphaproteobacteria bacterium]|nr:NAD(+)/NADH kinase [Alphaproteobacteria bacterium]
MNSSIYEFADLPAPKPGARPAAAAGAGRPRRSDSRRLSSRRARIGVIYNPRSHRNQGQDLALGDRHHVMVATPEKRSQIAAALADFASGGIDYLIINGGDGTVRDVLTCGHGVFGDDWPLLAVLPKGKTNALNVDLGAPADWSLRDAIDAFTSGTTVTRRPIEVAALDGRSAPLRGFILGAGAYTLGVRAGQDAHNFGFFDSLAVGMTTAWGVLQVVFGTDRNPWRRGVGMDLLLLPEGRRLPHSGHGDTARREVLLASTLARLPLGIKPFGPPSDPPREGLKFAVMDRPGRRLMACLPAVLAGWQPRWLERAGLHQGEAEAFEMTIDDQFILDGEAFPAGSYLVSQGPELTFVTA